MATYIWMHTSGTRHVYAATINCLLANLPYAGLMRRLRIRSTLCPNTRPHFNTLLGQGSPGAIGCMNGGGSFGGIIYTFMLRNLIPVIGFGWAVRAIALVTLALSVIAFAILLPRRPEVTEYRRAVFDIKALRELSFFMFLLALLLKYVAFYIPPFYVATSATSALGLSRNFAFECLVFVSAGSFVGRTVPMLAATHFGSLQVYIAATVETVVVLFAWMAVKDIPGFVTFCVMYGIVSGVQVAAPSAAMSHPVLSPTNVIGTRMCIAWMFAGIGVLIGAPIAGALVKATPGKADFTPAQGFAGAVAADSVLCSMVPFFAIIEHDRKIA